MVASGLAKFSTTRWTVQTTTPKTHPHKSNTWKKSSADDLRTGYLYLQVEITER